MKADLTVEKSEEKTGNREEMTFLKIIQDLYKVIDLCQAVVVAQLAERSLLIPEDPGSNPVIGNFH